jgi:hypothetical protein
MPAAKWAEAWRDLADNVNKTAMLAARTVERLTHGSINRALAPTRIDHPGRGIRVSEGVNEFGRCHWGLVEVMVAPRRNGPR